MSVDDAHAALVAAVKEIGAWDNTYVNINIINNNSVVITRSTASVI